MTKKRPILFSAMMVQAILDGRKTITRRVVKHQDCVEFNKEGAIYVHHPKCPSYCDYGCNGVGFGESPYGLKGDHLWVREAWGWQPEGNYFNTETKETNPMFWRANPNYTWEMPSEKQGVGYRANGASPMYPPIDGWKPSIHMWRWASRISLEITDVRVERLQEITDMDAIKEGCEHPGVEIADGFMREVFHGVWDSINGKKYPWLSNPWVWVIEFKRLEL